MVDTTYQPKIYKKNNGDNLIVASGGEIDFESGASLKIAGTAVTASAAELNIIDGVTADKDEINKLNGVTAGTVTASKAIVAGANKNVDVLAIADLKLGAGAGTSITATAIEINKLASAGAKVASGTQQAHVANISEVEAVMSAAERQAFNAVLTALEAFGINLTS